MRIPKILIAGLTALACSVPFVSGAALLGGSTEELEAEEQAMRRANEAAEVFNAVFPGLLTDVFISIGPVRPYEQSPRFYNIDPERSPLRFFILPITFSYTNTLRENFAQKINAAAETAVIGRGRLPRRFAQRDNGFQKVIFSHCTTDDCNKVQYDASYALKDPNKLIPQNFHFPNLRIRLLDEKNQVIVEETMIGRKNGKRILRPKAPENKRVLRYITGFPLAYGVGGNKDEFHILPERTVDYLICLEPDMMDRVISVNVAHVPADPSQEEDEDAPNW